jgi:pyruvate dehydrogenase E2 component (dihydrolipoamide acetyltransferase)
MIYEFRFPDIGEGVHEGIVLEWRRSPGDRVSQGDVLALVETDKVAAEIPSPADGTLVSRGVEEGATIEVGQVLASLEVAEEPAAGSPAPAAAQAPEPPAAAPAPVAVPAEAVPEPAGCRRPGRAARRHRGPPGSGRRHRAAPQH